EVHGETTFVPEKTNGSVDLTFEVNASALQGQTVVAFERLYRDEIEVGSHTDIEDEGQSVAFTDPQIRTLATYEDGLKIADPTGEIELIDTVELKGLIPDKEYRLDA